MTSPNHPFALATPVCPSTTYFDLSEAAVILEQPLAVLEEARNAGQLSSRGDYDSGAAGGSSQHSFLHFLEYRVLTRTNFDMLGISDPRPALTLAIRIIWELYQTNEDLGLCLEGAEVFPLLELELADALQSIPAYPEIGNATATHVAYTLMEGLRDAWIELDERLAEWKQCRGRVDVA